MTFRNLLLEGAARLDHGIRKLNGGAFRSGGRKPEPGKRFEHRGRLMAAPVGSCGDVLGFECLDRTAKRVLDRPKRGTVARC